MVGDCAVLKELRRRSLILANKAHDGNLQSVFSSLEIMWWIYNQILDLNGIASNDLARDYFLCSKGQATLGLLLILSKKAFISDEEIDSYGEFNSRISMQADRTKFATGIEMSAGSLGHGLPLATGIALSKSIQGLSGNVYVMIGDGELHEGTNWEAIEVIGSRRLSNLWIIVDDNGSHGFMHSPHGICARVSSFGYDVVECNGHDIDDLSKAYKSLELSNKPKMICAHTRRGYGAKTLMTDKSWFHKAPSDSELAKLLTEVDSFDSIEAMSYKLI